MNNVIAWLCLAACALAVPAIAAAKPPGNSTAGPTVVLKSDGAVLFDDGVVVAEPGDDGETDGFGSCPQTWVCLWSNTNYVGQMIAFQKRATWLNLGAYGFNNDAESWRNRTNDDAKLSKYWTGNSNHPGQTVCLNNNSSSASLGSFGNTASSIRVTNGGGIC